MARDDCWIRRGCGMLLSCDWLSYVSIMGIREKLISKLTPNQGLCLEYRGSAICCWSRRSKRDARRVRMCSRRTR